MIHHLDLNGRWAVSMAGSTDSIPAVVPGCIHTDLLAAKRIPDPYFRANENDMQWIGEKDWVYSRTFDVPAELLERDRVLLRCEGLDTLAEIRINGKPFAKTDNAFRTWEFPVGKALKAGRNTIEIRLCSVPRRVAGLQAKRSLPNWGSGQYKVPGGSWIRKSGCNFGWDWGPKLLTCGIWRPISIVAFDTARLTDVHIRQDHTKPGVVRLAVRVAAEVVGRKSLHAFAFAVFNGRVQAMGEVNLQKGEAEVPLAIREPHLWWPNGLGEQPLYTVYVEIRDANGEVFDMAEKRIGLRTLELVREKDPWGESFCFAANGVRFFGKGANWIPADTFVTRVTRADYERLLRDAAAAHMNMTRVWGGGIYEDDMFYDQCDELGICVWQDFMFACSTYPTFDSSYMRNVEQEARDNVRRIRHHPSIAMWCGNNELEQGLVADTWTGHQMSWKDYGRLFDELLPRVVRELDPERPYWPCSPHSPHGDRRDFNNPTCGDAHLWSVWHGRQPFEWYRGAFHRFCSEFGFQSFPEPKTVRTYTKDEDRNVTSFVMEHHQRSGNGNSAIMDYMLSWFRLPVGFESTLWLSQILQGLGIKYAVDHWRRHMPQTMGAIYWQLNDCWQVASWSSIDWFGRWKALHYFARRFFAPIAVTAVEDVSKGAVDLYAANDRLESKAGVVRWTLTDALGKTVAAAEKKVKMQKQTSGRIMRIDVKKALAEHGPRNLILWGELWVDDECVSTDLALFARPKHIDLATNPGIGTTIKKAVDGGFDVTLRAKKAALWVWMELEGLEARYGDNFFHLRPGEPVTVTVKPAVETSVGTVRERLVVRSLVDTYRESL